MMLLCQLETIHYIAESKESKRSCHMVLTLYYPLSPQYNQYAQLLLYRLLYLTSAPLRLMARPMLLHSLNPKGQNNPHTHHQPIPQHTLYNRMSPGSCFWLPLWPFKLGVDLLKVLLLSAVENSAGLTKQLWLGHVQPQPVWEDLERKVGVPHGLTVTINLQGKKTKVGVPHGLTITIKLQEKKRKDYTFRQQFNEKQLVCSN